MEEEMSTVDSPWDEKVLNDMKQGAVTFAWDDGEIRTITAPAGTLDTMKSAWEWIDLRMKELLAEKGRPRTLCFRLSTGEFRGLKFPDWKPGIDEPE